MICVDTEGRLDHPVHPIQEGGAFQIMARKGRYERVQEIEDPELAQNG